MVSTMIDSSLRCKAFVHQIRKRFSLPSELSDEDCFIVYSKELELHRTIFNDMIDCLNDLNKRKQLYEFARYLQAKDILYHYSQIYSIRNRTEPSDRLVKSNTLYIYKTIIREYKLWITKEVHNVKEARINSIRKRIDNYFQRTTMLKALEILNCIKKEETFEKFMEMSEEELNKYLDEAIKELETLQSRSCEGCKYETQGRYRVPCDVCARTLHDEYTTKEQ